MHALHQEVIPPSGVEFATSLKLIPGALELPPNASTRHEIAARVLCNVVVARSNILRIFEVREEPAPLPAVVDEEKDRKALKKGADAVPGEVEMDRQGEGFVNIAKLVTQKSSVNTVTKFYHVREHHMHGIVTGMEGVKTVASIEDKLDRLLVSFKDAKIALLEWSDAVNDLITVSIHTYERAPQLVALDTSLYRAELRVDPMSRCAALSLPKDAIAILPFYQSQAELDAIEVDQSQTRDIPYSPSFILDLPNSVDKDIHHVIDFVFLPGFNNPTMAVLFQPQPTWIGRLKEYKDTVRLVIFTLDIQPQNFPIITSVEGLPHDCISLLPCSTSFGGVVIVTANSLIYVDQAARRVALPVNGWASRITDLAYPPTEDQTRNLLLDGCRATFLDDKTIFVILKNGTVYPVELIADGKSVTKLTMGQALAQTTIPSLARMVAEERLLLGSTAGPSVLLKTARVEEEVEDDEDMIEMAVVDSKQDVIMDDDSDIYGPAEATETLIGGSATANGLSKKKTRSIIHLSLCDSIPSHGPIADVAMSVARNGDRLVPELVAATGVGVLGGFTLFQRDLPFRTKRKLHIIGGGRGMWSLPIRQSIKASGISFEKATNPYQFENDNLIISTDVNPSPGLSRISTRTAKGDINITVRIPGTTVGAATIFQRTAILHVMTNSIRVLEPDGTERQIIKDMDGHTPRAKIRACSISDPFVLIFREDDSIGLFVGETERGKIRRKDMSPMGEKSSRYLTGCFFTDSTGLFEKNHQTNIPPPSATSEKGGNITSTLQSVVSAENRTQWLMLVRPQGVMEIWTLPKLSLVFSNSMIATLQNVLTDSHDAPGSSLPQDPPRKPQDLDIEQVVIAPIGESRPQPHLFVLLRSGHMAVYQTVPAGSTSLLESPAAPRSAHVAIKFVKVLARFFEISRPEESAQGILAEQKRIIRNFTPFTTMCTSGTTFSGVFFTGDNPSWVLGTDKGGVRLFPSGHTVVHAFTPCSLWGSKAEFLVYSDEGPSLLEWIPEFQIDGPLPSRSIPRGRAYSSVVFDPSTSLVVASATLEAQFTSYDEDGNRIWEPDDVNISDPTVECSTLELISPDLWVTMDGYEFANNEIVNAVACITLETASTETGSKEFIAVGTTINRGEDLAAKGATYIFEIVEVVPDPSLAPKRWYKLRLRCRDDAKGPVTAVCGLNGYLVSSMGQKIFVRAFDLDERLVGVAFMDVGLYVTSLQTIKNVLLISDAVKSISFVAFQEEPYKLVLLAKDVHHCCITKADFFFTANDLSLIACDEEGIVRMYDYSPQDPNSRDGRHLLLRTEYNAHAEIRSSAVIARRTIPEAVIPESRIIYGATNGSLVCLTPVDEAVSKHLQLLQGQLTRNIQHVAGLNPKALRIVRNDFVSKPLSKGILDGNLLRHFEALPVTKQAEMTRQIGTEVPTALKDWIALDGVW
ncbi:cleavage and polyadenylation specific protein [Moniliophthora roreri MCA 2997]|uniref:Cleavage and polyadenylation specific protein n=1 Tax=Moniliophthora roreri (strain MCA 2997) TaxID=1381753 RepID=V2XWE8_MONRO|nr:cleavage and polyadenylation specific protein [Moniliophthora roreri MCA 2997]